MKATLVAALSLAGSTLAAPPARRSDEPNVSQLDLSLVKGAKMWANDKITDCGKKEHVELESERGRYAVLQLIDSKRHYTVDNDDHDRCRNEVEVPPGCFHGDEPAEGCLISVLKAYDTCTEGS
ncbi:uncharacterized protein MAM_02692 [Metarhizium album ARSEF 1941]|uniref:Uncharacterized protein n=1 Tax=Metarhizium album (strain ARSEF 1941) TaxID=1081103 RepID=A0A0B2X356_METAS|nr:uncharacterized protein MAM_02692 [Metarhizium album ARSEF 1941]KHN99839.1 hypothetical protein MAM_02692 [Metarhizium album ARSEF 1941]